MARLPAGYHGGVEARTRSVVAGLLGIGVAAGLLAWCFGRADMQRVASALRGLTFVAVLPALACEAMVQASKALKWTAILRGTHPVRYTSALSAVVVGAASTHIVPLRLDEVIRAAVLGRREGLPAAEVLGTVAIDRVIEVFIAGLLLGVVALNVELSGWMGLGARVLWGGFLVVMLLLVVFVRAEAQLRARLAHSVVPGVARVAQVLQSLSDGLRNLPRGRALGWVALGSAGEWLATIAFYAWTLHVFGVEGGGLALPVVMALGNAVAYAVPNVPGALGTYEAVQSSVLVAAGLGIGPAEAMAISLAAHAVLMLPVTVAGLGVGLFEWRRGGRISLSEAT